jgi:hypothetical protein
MDSHGGLPLRIFPKEEVELFEEISVAAEIFLCKGYPGPEFFSSCSSFYSAYDFHCFSQRCIRIG